MTINLHPGNRKQKGIVIWLSGLPCSGKTTIGAGLEKVLKQQGYIVRMLDGDITRKGICSDLGFSDFDRKENIRRVSEIAKLFSETGIITICAFITPTDEIRSIAHNIIGEGSMVSVFIDAPLEICEERDVKGMYKKARKGEIQEFTGVSSPFEIPQNPDLIISTNSENPEQSIKQLYDFLLPLIESYEE